MGPDDRDCVSTGALVDLFCEQWGESAKWVNCHDGGPHEANLLKLDCSKLKSKFGWKTTWHVDEAVEKTVEWTKRWFDMDDMDIVMKRQIETFLKVEGHDG